MSNPTRRLSRPRRRAAMLSYARPLALEAFKKKAIKMWKRPLPKAEVAV